MQTHTLPDGTILVQGKTAARRFTHIAAGLAWPETALGAMCVGGRRLDGRLHILREYEGGLTELAAGAAALGRNLPAFVVVVDATDRLAAKLLRNFSGLAPHTVIAGAPREYLAHYCSALEKIRAMWEEGTLLIHGDFCPKLVHALRRPPEIALKAPPVKAMTWAVTGLAAAEDPANLRDAEAAVWYRNLDKATLHS
jgi:hypothetical protein